MESCVDVAAADVGRCPQCGATPRDGLSCRAAFDELLALDTAEERAHSPDHQPLS